MSHYISRDEWTNKRDELFEFHHDEEEWDYETGNELPRFGVRLQHQCDAWQITRDDASRNEAIEDLEAFIAAAQSALARLEDMAEVTA